MSSFRSKDYSKIAGLLYLRLGANDMPEDRKNEILELVSKPESRDSIPWGGSQKVMSELRAIINHKRKLEGIDPITLGELKTALEMHLKGDRTQTLVEELNDALSNLREYKLGVNKFVEILPLNEALRQAS